ncbi:hypothetical protein GGR54DRAFT_624740 [Hypoxylon sp. NC1633]|nr:hypothetical protein GGR54DRAFT_624740 [Hypoxylon sp. NC1633]
MDPGTIISIVQVSSSILNFGLKVVHEFVGNDKIRDKLADLNRRLQTFHHLVAEIVDKTPDASPSRLEYPGTGNVIKTLNDCKEFLKQYERTLSTNRTLGQTTQRAWLVAGPDSSRLDDFHSRIDRHYMELNQWDINIRSRRRESRDMRTPVLPATSVPNPSPSNDIRATYNTDNLSPPLTSAEWFSDDTITELPPANFLTPSRANRSPILRPTPRNLSLGSIPELPPPLASSAYPFDADTRRHTTHLENGPVMDYIARGRPSPVNPTTFRTELGDRVSESRDPSSGLSSPQFRISGHTVTLRIGNQPYKFDTGFYRILNHDAARVIEWYNLDSGVMIRHFVQSDTYHIPHTIPDDKHFRVFFIPRIVNHQVDIITGNSTPESHPATPEYRFDHKPDRETFQSKLRGCDYFKMIRAVKIHSAKERDIAIKIHLKVWRRADQDEDPTFSFAALQAGQLSHHLEFRIRWFKKTPELRGDTKLVLRPYSTDSDLDYGPTVPTPSPPAERRRSIRNLTRRMSGDSNQPGSGSPHSRSSSASAPPLILYDCKGRDPPAEVQDLGHLEIEFSNSELRKQFINACYEAHRPARAASTPSPVSQRTSSRPASWASTPTAGQGPFELSGAQPVHELGDTGFQRHELGDTGFRELDDTSFQMQLSLPPPSLTISEEVVFNTHSLFAPPRALPERGRARFEAGESGRGSYAREPG